MSFKFSSFLIITTTILVLGRFFLTREDAGEYDTMKIMRSDGYSGESHYVKTEDGYILGLQRIKRELHTPVLLLHGLESSAVDWIIVQKNNSLPYLLYEEGYDIWLGNVRGTPSSYNHTFLNPDEHSFWNSSLHEIGHYDIPAMIDYILNETKFEKVFYVGMSQGETTFLIALSTRPEYNEKIQLACLTSAASHLKHTKNTYLKSAGKYWKTIKKVVEFLGVKKNRLRDFVGSICRYNVFENFCRIIIFPAAGNVTEKDMIRKISEVYPNYSSMNQLIHYLQMYGSGKFQMFDYEKDGNLQKYGSEKPPEYDITKISAPIAYFWGEEDIWSSHKDILNIIEKLQNVALNYRIPYDYFNHIDLMFSKDAKTLAYDEIISLIKKYSISRNSSNLKEEHYENVFEETENSPN